MSEENKSLFDEIEMFLSHPTEENEGGEGAENEMGVSGEEYNVEEVYKEKVYPILQKIVSLCDQEGIAAQFAAFPKCRIANSSSYDEMVVSVERFVCNPERRKEVSAAHLIYALPHSAAHMILYASMSPPLLLTKMMSNNGSQENEFFDKEEFFNQHLRSLVDDLGASCELYKVPIQWGMCIAVKKDADGVDIKYRGYYTEDLPFSECQVQTAMLCYSGVPKHFLLDILDLAPLAR